MIFEKDAEKFNGDAGKETVLVKQIWSQEKGLNK